MMVCVFLGMMTLGMMTLFKNNAKQLAVAVHWWFALFFIFSSFIIYIFYECTNFINMGYRDLLETLLDFFL